MTGILDIGGGQKAVYSAGLYDGLIDLGIKFDYYCGVSAGAANLASFIAGQRGRDAAFYIEYSFRREYIGMKSFLHNGNFFNLDYVYGTLSVPGGENPLDMDAIRKANVVFQVPATDVQTGRSVFFDANAMPDGDLSLMKATCSIPVMNRPQKMGDRYYFDGGVDDPVPYEKCLQDGCDRLIVVLNRPVYTIMNRQDHMGLIKRRLRRYPKIIADLQDRNSKYNREIRELMALEKEGKVLLMGPDDLCGVGTTSSDRDAFRRLYEKGYDDSGKVRAFVEKCY